MTDLQGKSGEPQINVKKIHANQEIQQAQQIRYNVFVLGQNVPPEEEIDKFETESFHFLAYIDGTPCGAARWRFTEKGIKLERFAVLENYRDNGVGSALVDAVLKDIDSNPDSNGKQLYLNAQLAAMKLYSKFGFKKEGELFQECDIDHFKMVKY
ncbi:MAG: GNAT family N-acetyltransferase [Cyclobacteriaceae bacterium]|nr:GNAT family N-acetyltransferase [Cyclobacteriaceae bacterium]